MGVADLSPLGPERGVQLAVGQQAGLQAGQELQQVAPLREAERGPLDAILAHQYHRAATVHWGRTLNLTTDWWKTPLAGCTLRDAHCTDYSVVLRHWLVRPNV